MTLLLNLYIKQSLSLRKQTWNEKDFNEIKIDHFGQNRTTTVRVRSISQSENRSTTVLVRKSEKKGSDN